MIIPENRYSTYRYKKSNRKIVVFVLVLLIVSALIILSYTLFSDSRSDQEAGLIALEEKTLEELWLDGKYRELGTRCEIILETEPLNPEGLIYNGFAYFHLGIAQFTLEDQLPLLDIAVVNLRKALLLKSGVLSGKVNYVLGKSYYHKGRFFMDQAIIYLEKSINMGFINDDSYKYLGLSYSELGLYQVGVEYFLKAVNSEDDDMLYLVLGQTYHKLGDELNSIAYLKRAIELNNDFRVGIKSRFLLGKIFFEDKNYEEAEKQYNLILAQDEKSADAHYYLGEIFFEKNDTVKARAEWRKSLEIEPSHYGALLRLYPN